MPVVQQPLHCPPILSSQAIKSCIRTEVSYFWHTITKSTFLFLVGVREAIDGVAHVSLDKGARTSQDMSCNQLLGLLSVLTVTL